MKNKGEKRGEKKKKKKTFVVVWLTVENGKDLVGPKSFLIGPTKTQYPQIGENIIENICTKMPKLGFFKLRYVRCYL